MVRSVIMFAAVSLFAAFKLIELNVNKKIFAKNINRTSMRKFRKTVLNYMKTVPGPTLSAYDMLIDIGIMIKYQRISSMPEDGQQGIIIEQFIQLVVIIAAAFCNISYYCQF
ncbi:transcriptional regulator, MarR family [Trichinella spiralis]|uniref:transcriptional regulator, MarR family n=1 Tax=Trichinella spiralis TaxID=6334 RepID=UPI0001EFCA94|nr:transcriptional regulator, MarR family [Trichinella spiralis]